MNDSDSREYDLEERMIGFVIRILCVIESLPHSRIGNHVADQLVRSGTSPASNYGEAQSADSRKDFIHKMKISLKELRETLIWLLVAQRKPLILPAERLEPIVRETHELIAIFATSIATARRNLNDDKQ